MEFLSALSPLDILCNPENRGWKSRLCDPENRAWKSRFHSPIGSKPNQRPRSYLRGRNLAGQLHNRSRKKTILSLYQVDAQTKHAQIEKHLNSTKRIIKGRIRAIYYRCNTRYVACFAAFLIFSHHILHNSYCLFSFSFLFHGILTRIITSWSLMRPRKKRLKIPI